MKLLVYEKKLSVTGKHTTVCGRVLINMNDAKYLHKVQGYINGKLHWSRPNLSGDDMVLYEAARCEMHLLSDMDDIANKEPIKSFHDKLVDLGFSNMPY